MLKVNQRFRNGQIRLPSPFLQPFEIHSVRFLSEKDCSGDGEIPRELVKADTVASGLYKIRITGTLFTTENWADSNLELFSSQTALSVYAGIQLFSVA